jgi:hypothetical protein
VATGCYSVNDIVFWMECGAPVYKEATLRSSGHLFVFLGLCCSTEYFVGDLTVACLSWWSEVLSLVARWDLHRLNSVLVDYVVLLHTDSLVSLTPARIVDATSGDTEYMVYVMRKVAATVFAGALLNGEIGYDYVQVVRVWVSILI